MKKNFIESILNGLNELYRKKWKHIFIVIYTIISFYLWNISCALWELFPFNQLPKEIFQLIKISFFGIIIILLTLLLLQIIIYIGKFTYLGLNKKLEKGFKRCNLKNNENEYPTLYDIQKDKNTKHGLIYRFNNQQIPIEEFSNKVPSLEILFKGQIHNISYCKENLDITCIPVIPYKYVTPYIINTNDDALSTMDNCLIVGQTRFSEKVIQHFLYLEKYLFITKM